MGEGETNGSTSLSDLEKKIIYQMEYYFGDMNLPRDKFLQEKIKEDEGYVTLEVLLTFNRLKEISPDADVIVAAVRKSQNALIEVSEDGMKVRRSPDKPLPENTKERRDELANRTVYCKGFSQDSTFDPLKAFFETHGPIENVFLRRNGKTFKGSVFATFKDQTDAEKFVKSEGMKYQDIELVKLFKNDYYAKKQEERRKDKLEKEKAAKEETAKQFKEHIEDMKDRITLGTILHLEGFRSDITREDVRNYFEDFSKVAWVDYNPGDKKGQVRFSEENQAKVALEKAKEANNDKVEICGSVLIGRVYEGEEEVNHWKMIFTEGSNKRNQRKPMKKGRGKFGSFKGKRKGRNDEDEPAAKMAKTE